MRTVQISKHRTLGHGHHCRDVRIEGQVIRKGLTSKEATDWVRDHEKALKGIIGHVVARELERVAQFAQSNRDNWHA